MPVYARIVPYMRKQVGAIDGALLDRVDAARGDVPRTKLIERLLGDWLAGRVEQASGAAAPGGGSGARREGVRTAADPAPPPPTPAESERNETPLPKIARRRWAT